MAPECATIVIPPHKHVVSIGLTHLELEADYGIGRGMQLTLHTSIDGQYQTLGRWSGVVDEGSGFEDGGLRLQVSLPFRGLSLSSGIYHQLWSHGFDEQTFRQKTTWSLSMMRMF